MADEENNGVLVDDASNSGVVQEESSYSQSNLNNDNSDTIDVALDNVGNTSDDDTLEVGLEDVGNDKSDNRDQSDDDGFDVDVEDVGNDKSTTTNTTSFAMDQQIEDSFKDQSDNSDDDTIDVALDNVGNDSSSDDDDNSTNVDVAIEDAFKDQSMTDSGNDNSDNSMTDSGNDNSQDNDTDNSTTVDVALEDAFKDESMTDSGNDNSQDNDQDNDTTTTVDVGIEDAFKSATDSYNDASSHFGEIDVAFENVFGGGFGAGNDMGFAMNQVADIVDNDQLSDFEQNNGGTFTQTANPGTATVGGDWDGVDDPFGEAGGSILSTADASATASGTAFNMEVVLGANLQQNAVDISIVGGSTDDDVTNGDSF